MSNGTSINKSISVGHIITTIALVVGGFTFIYDLREQVALAEYKMVEVERRMERMEVRNKDQFGEIMEHLFRLENKLDKLFEDARS